MKLHQRSISGTTEQESLMREILEELEEVATMLSYDPWPGDFEIVSISRNEWKEVDVREKTVIKSATAPSRSSATVVSYQDYKRLRLRLSA